MLRVRTAGPDDVPAILRMMVEFNRHEEIDWSPAKGEQPLRRLLADPSLGTVGLAWIDGVHVGYYG
jgi:hypothetical protein